MENITMTLNTDARKVKKPMNGADFQIGMGLSLLGIDQVHEKLLPELKLRTTLVKALIPNIISDKLVWEDFLGFKTNVGFEMRSAWFNRIQKHNAPKPLTKKQLREIGVWGHR
tara:strand:+ start:106 stop:444 length:339 start_codon:yes stop_codon:yes gene_type:complete